MGYKKTLDYLYSLESPRIRLGLERVQNLLNKIGNPQSQLKCIHVAGTNGKGSVCAMIFYILKEAGYKVGLYTSPHLKKFNERIRVNGNLITDREIVEHFLKVKPHITNQSFFEITTAMAFLYFKEQNVDFAVLETGLGGRLDATNVVMPLVSVITNIGLEHTNLLGATIEKIAYEKAGIIKNNVSAVTGCEGKALSVIKKIAKKRNAPLFIAKKYKKANFQYLNGIYQQKNKDIALETIDTLIRYHSIKISEKQIINGLKKTKWPARLEFVSKNVLVDCAHNPDGFETLKKELILIKKRRKIKNFIFVVGIQNDKDAYSMLKTINPLVYGIIFTKSNNLKALSPIKLKSIFNKINKKGKKLAIAIKNPKAALKYAKSIAKKNDLAVVAGSIYIVGEVI